MKYDQEWFKQRVAIEGDSEIGAGVPPSSDSPAKPDFVYEVTGYTTSRDYEKLTVLMQVQSIICIVNYGDDCRDVAHTIWSKYEKGGAWQISARGTGYIYAFDKETFIAACKTYNVEFIVPS